MRSSLSGNLAYVMARRSSSGSKPGTARGERTSGKRLDRAPLAVRVLGTGLVGLAMVASCFCSCCDGWASTKGRAVPGVRSGGALAGRSREWHPLRLLAAGSR